MSDQNLPAIASAVADQIGYTGTDLVATLKATCFSGSKAITDKHMVALLMVAQAHKLNPFTREIFAFPQGDGVVPVVSVDGWLRIINTHPQMDGLEFEHCPNGSWCTATIYRKDRERPTRVTEFLQEAQRNTDTWRKYPQRMLRHKATIQAARYAFGFSGFYDQDEAERMDDAPAQERDVTPVRKTVSIESLTTGDVLQEELCTTTDS